MPVHLNIKLLRLYSPPKKSEESYCEYRTEENKRREEEEEEKNTQTNTETTKCSVTIIQCRLR